MTYFPPHEFPLAGRIIKVRWLVIVAFSKQILRRPWFMLLVGKKRLYLSLDNYSGERQVPCIPRGSLECPVCYVLVSRTGSHFLWVWILCKTPPTVESICFLKWKHRQTLELFYSTACSLGFFRSVYLKHNFPKQPVEGFYLQGVWVCFGNFTFFFDVDNLSCNCFLLRLPPGNFALKQVNRGTVWIPE